MTFLGKINEQGQTKAIDYDKKLVKALDRLLGFIFKDIYIKNFLIILYNQDLMILRLHTSHKKICEELELLGIMEGKVVGCMGFETGVVFKNYVNITDSFRNSSVVTSPIKNNGGNTIGYLEVWMFPEGDLDLCKMFFQSLIIALKNEIILLSQEQLVTEALQNNSRLMDIEKELTPREREICYFLLRRCSSKEIAKSLNISEMTVITHRRNIYRKLRVRGLTGLYSLLTIDEQN